MVALFSFASCSSESEPRKATADEARVLRAMDGLSYENLKSGSTADDLNGKRALTIAINTGDIKLDTDLNVDEGSILHKLVFSLTGFKLNVTDDEGTFDLAFDGSVNKEFKAGFADNNFTAMDSLTVSADVVYNGKTYNVRIVENFSAGASPEKLYFIGDVQVTL